MSKSKAVLETVAPSRSEMFAHIVYQNCDVANHSTCTEENCDSNILASDYWEHRRLQDIKDRKLAEMMAPMLAASAN